MNKKGIVTQDDQRILSEIENAIDMILSKMKEGGFVRMSTRSPKDASIGKGIMKKLLNEEIQRIPDTASDRERQSAEFIAFFRAQKASLRVTTGR